MSVCGPSKGKYEFYHFNQQILREIGASVALCIYESQNTESEEYALIMSEIQETIINKKDKVELGKDFIDSDDSNEEKADKIEKFDEFKDFKED